ncbi:hypothetical protein [Vibrio gallaecicus]|nr:hypothetical protein [Vibrio gallaecicus]MDN3615099.1 hypothetical protein [Vibrio gallaecicus]
MVFEHKNTVIQNGLRSRSYSQMPRARLLLAAITRCNTTFD